MNIVNKIQEPALAKHDIAVLILRVALGIIITLKGLIFLNNLALLHSLIQKSYLSNFGESFWIYYVALTSLLCGIFIIMGLFARIAALLQIPVLIGAVLFINPGDHGFVFNGELILSFFVLVMLFYFLFKGPGLVSMDNYLLHHDL